MDERVTDRTPLNDFSLRAGPEDFGGEDYPADGPQPLAPLTVPEAQARLDAARAFLGAPPPGPDERPVDFLAAAQRLQSLATDPTHADRLARNEAALRAAGRRALAALARERDLPEDEDLRAVALDAAPPETPALAALRAAADWRRGRRCGCVAIVGGPRGLGKSCALAWVLLRSEASALYVQAPDVTATPRNGFSDNEARWARWLSVPLLGVDDLGTEAGDTELVASLLWQRYDRGLRTLVTTNLARAAVADRYLRGEIGARLADRLVNAQGCAVGRVTPGPGGLPWYAGVAGASLRNAEARAALTSAGGT